MLFFNKEIICFQNGTSPKRVFTTALDGKSVHIIAQNQLPKGEPTQGVITEDQLYYIANSAWDAYNELNVYSQEASPLEVHQINLSTKTP